MSILHKLITISADKIRCYSYPFLHILQLQKIPACVFGPETLLQIDSYNSVLVSGLCEGQE